MTNNQTSVDDFSKSILSLIREKTEHYHEYYRISKDIADDEHGRHPSANEKLARDKSVWQAWSYLENYIEKIDVNSVKNLNEFRHHILTQM